MKVSAFLFALAIASELPTPRFALAAPPLPDAATQSMRAHFDAGVRAYDAKPPDYVHALDEFRAAYRDKASPIIKQNIALCLRALGRYVEATTTLREMLDEGGNAIKPHVRDLANKAIAEMGDLVATAKVVIQARAAQNAPDLRPALIVDGAVVPPAKIGEPMRLDPGEHRFRAHADGYTDAEQTMTLAQGQRDVQVVLELVAINAPLPALAPSSSSSSAVQPVPPPPPIDAPPPAVTPKAKSRHYIAVGLTLQSERLTLTQAAGEKTTATHPFTGAGAIVRIGRHLDKYWDVGALGELGVFAAEDYASPLVDAPQIPAKTGVVNWALAPELRVHSAGRLRALASIALGAEGTILSATVAEKDAMGVVTRPVHSGGGVGLMAMIEVGGQLELGRAFLEGVFFVDVHGVGGVKDNGPQPLIADTSAARGGFRLLIGFRF